jgi:hypothetical protein
MLLKELDGVKMFIETDEDFFPEKNFFAQMIVRAILDINLYSVHPKDAVEKEQNVFARQALAWIVEGDSGAISFNLCSSALELCPIRLRKRVKNLRQEE